MSGTCEEEAPKKSLWYAEVFSGVEPQGGLRDLLVRIREGRVGKANKGGLRRQLLMSSAAEQAGR